MFTTFAAIAFFASQPSAPISLGRHYKENDKASYSVVAEVDQNGQQMTIDALIDYKIKMLREKGEADVELTTAKLEATAGGAAVPGFDNPGPQTFTADSHGMLRSAKFHESEAVFAILGISSYLPDSSLEVGDSAPVNWTSDDFKAVGNVKLLEIKEVEGKKVAVLKSKVEVTPTGDTPATIEMKSEIDLASGMLIKADGTALSDEFNAKIKISSKKSP